MVRTVFGGVYQPRIKVLVIYMQLSETPKLGFTWVVNANLLIHGRQKCPKYCLSSTLNIFDDGINNRIENRVTLTRAMRPEKSKPIVFTHIQESAPTLDLFVVKPARVSPWMELKAWPWKAG